MTERVHSWGVTLTARQVEEGKQQRRASDARRLFERVGPPRPRPAQPTPARSAAPAAPELPPLPFHVLTAREIRELDAW